jgi:hypothetical protein
LPPFADAILASVSVPAKGYEAFALSVLASVFVAAELRSEPGVAANGDGTQGRLAVIRGLEKESIVLLRVNGMRFNSVQPAGMPPRSWRSG